MVEIFQKLKNPCSVPLVDALNYLNPVVHDIEIAELFSDHTRFLYGNVAIISKLVFYSYS